MRAASRKALSVLSPLPVLWWSGAITGEPPSSGSPRASRSFRYVDTLSMVPWPANMKYRWPALESSTRTTTLAGSPPQATRPPRISTSGRSAILSPLNPVGPPSTPSRRPDEAISDMAAASRRPERPYILAISPASGTLSSRMVGRWWGWRPLSCAAPLSRSAPATTLPT